MVFVVLFLHAFWFILVICATIFTLTNNYTDFAISIGFYTLVTYTCISIELKFNVALTEICWFCMTLICILFFVRNLVQNNLYLDNSITLQEKNVNCK
jgi:hypothetical protein